MLKIHVAGLALVAVVKNALAACPNDCSGNGDCTGAAQCECYTGYHGQDCSKRLCSFGNAFVDTPLGDVNGDNNVGIDLVYRAGVANAPQSEQYHGDYAAARSTFRDREDWDEAHFYQECSGKGICNTISGICECFEGYTGEACARLDCPNDCSDFGTCKSYEGTRYEGWDKAATHYCQCDPGFTGPACQIRVCPTGLDPVEASNVDTSNFQRIAFRGFDGNTFNSDAASVQADVDAFALLPFGDLEFTITVEDDFGNEWTTELITIKYDVLANVNASGSLPFADTNWDTGGADEPYYVFPRPLNSDETIVYGEHTTVPDQVIAAIEKLPHGIGKGVRAHAVYVAPNIADLAAGAELDDYYAVWSDDDVTCTEGSDECPSEGLVGCGVPVWWSNDDEDVRNGNHDIDWFIANGCVNNVLQLCAADCENVGASDSSTISPLADADSDGTSISNVGGFVYYATPHYDNDLGADERFPLFSAQSNKAGDFKHAHFMMDVDQTTFTANENEIAGLSLFIRFAESVRVTQPIRIDYFYNNQMPELFVDTNGLTSQFFGAGGQTIEACTTCTEDDSVSDVVVATDVTSYRTWDTAYHGRQMSFLGDGSYNADLDFHACSRRGLCDTEAGECQCFGGYTGTNCAIVNALASD